MDNNFHSYFRNLTVDEWADYWSSDRSNGYQDEGALIAETSPLGWYVEVMQGSANQEICLDRCIDRIELAAEEIRLQYYVRHKIWDKLAAEFVKIDSTIDFVKSIRIGKYYKYVDDSVDAAKALAQCIENWKAENFKK